MKALRTASLIEDTPKIVRLDVKAHRKWEAQIDKMLCSGADSCFLMEANVLGTIPTFKGLFEGSTTFVYAIHKQEEVLAVVSLQPLAEEMWYMRSLCVSNKWRGMGLGTQLLRFLQDEYTRLMLYVWNHKLNNSERLLKFYHDHGFKETLSNSTIREYIPMVWP